MPRYSPEAVKARRLASLVSAAHRVARKAEARNTAADIQRHAEARQWGACDTERHTGISRRAFTRLARGELDLEVWLPKLRRAAALIQGLQP